MFAGVVDEILRRTHIHLNLIEYRTLA